jgi:spore coat polysaccharide biosynthesis protein SpsF
MRKLVACLACRNNGSRLYGKPMQNLDIQSGFSVLDYIIASTKKYPGVAETVLGISEGKDNECFIEVAEKHAIPYIIGNETDVLKRLIQCCEAVGGTDIFRVTTESPFMYFEAIEKAWQQHVEGNYDFSMLDNLPDGSGVEIIKLDAYKYSWTNGEDRHRTELCSLYIRENKNKFRIQEIEAPKEVKRMDIRLTIDYPEDLILCRAVYQRFKEKAPLIPLSDIIQFLDQNPKLKELVQPFVEEGLQTMYI